LQALLGGDDLSDALLDVLEQLQLLVVAVVQRLAGVFRAVEQLGDLRLDDGGEPSTDAGHHASWSGEGRNRTLSGPTPQPLRTGGLACLSGADRRLARLPKPALGHEAVGEQQQRLVGGRAEALLGVRRVDAALEPAGELAHPQADEVRAVVVREQPGTPAARGQRARRGERDAARTGITKLDGHDARVAVGPAPAEQRVAQRPGAARGALDVHARRGAVARRGLRRRPGRRPRRAVDLGLAGAVEAGPDRDALDVDVHRYAVGVVLAQPAVPEHAAPRRAHVRLGSGPHDLVEVGPVGPLGDPRRAVDEHELAALVKAVLAGVVEQRDLRPAPD